MSGALPFGPSPVDHAVMQPENRVERRQAAAHVTALGARSADNDMGGVMRLSFQGRMKQIDRRKSLDAVDLGQCERAGPRGIAHQAMCFVECTSPDAVHRPPRLANILAGI